MSLRSHLRVAVACVTALALLAAAPVAHAAPTRCGRVRLPRKVAGFSFTSLPPNAAQTYRQRGRRGTKRIRFDYVVPNG